MFLDNEATDATFTLITLTKDPLKKYFKKLYVFQGISLIKVSISIFIKKPLKTIFKTKKFQTSRNF